MSFNSKQEKLGQNISKLIKLGDDEPSRKEAAFAISHGLIDMEESFHRIIEISNQMQGRDFSEGELEGALHDIGEELRHIIYHINDMKFYDYLK